MRVIGAMKYIRSKIRDKIKYTLRGLIPGMSVLTISREYETAINIGTFFKESFLLDFESQLERGRIFIVESRLSPFSVRRANI